MQLAQGYKQGEAASRHKSGAREQGVGVQEFGLCTARCQPQACKRGIPENSPSMAKKSASSMAWYTLWRLLLKSAEKPRRGSEPVA